MHFDNIKALYHGSDGGIIGPIKIDKSKSSINDFGYGFYLGELEEQAKSRIQNVKVPVLYKYTLDITNTNVYYFTDDTLWALYIAYNRQKFDFSKYKKLVSEFKKIDKFDIVVGYIADDKISDAYIDFLEGNLTDIGLSESLKLVKYGKQYVIKNIEVTKPPYLVEISHVKLNKSERLQSIDWSKKIKSNMLTDLDKIKIKYRNDGLYIDQILNNWRK